MTRKRGPPQGPRRKRWERLHHERLLIIAKVRQLQTDRDSYNDNRPAGTPPIVLGPMPVPPPQCGPMPAWDE